MNSIVPSGFNFLLIWQHENAAYVSLLVCFYSLTWEWSSFMCLLATSPFSVLRGRLTHPLPLARPSPHQQAQGGEDERKKEGLSWWQFSPSRAHGAVPVRPPPCPCPSRRAGLLAAAIIFTPARTPWIVAQGRAVPKSSKHTTVGFKSWAAFLQHTANLKDSHWGGRETHSWWTDHQSRGVVYLQKSLCLPLEYSSYSHILRYVSTKGHIPMDCMDTAEIYSVAVGGHLPWLFTQLFEMLCLPRGAEPGDPGAF